MTEKQLMQYSKATLVAALALAIRTSFAKLNLVEFIRLHDLRVKTSQWDALGSRITRDRDRALRLAIRSDRGERLTSSQRVFLNSHLCRIARFKTLDPIVRPHLTPATSPNAG